MNNEIFKKVDRIIGGPVCFLLSFFSKNKPLPKNFNPKKILVIKLVALGDMVVLLPSLKALKKKFPESQISLLTTPRTKAIIEGFKWVDRVIFWDITGIWSFVKQLFMIREQRFGLVIDFEQYYCFTSILSFLSGAVCRSGFYLNGKHRGLLYNFRVPYLTDVHEVESFFQIARFFGASNKEIRLESIPFTEEDKEKTKNIKKGDVFLVDIHPGTGPSAKARRWLAERWADLIKRLIKEPKMKVIVSGGPDNRDVVNEIYGFLDDTTKSKIINLVGEISIKEFAALCRHIDLMISVDTGPMHIGAAMGAKVIGLFGPNIPEKWGPYGKGNIAIRKDPNPPCTRLWLGEVCRCRNGHMESIMVKDVLRAYDKIIKRN